MKSVKPQTPHPLKPAAEDPSDTSGQPTPAQVTPDADRDFFLTRDDAAAGGPADASVTGEEDPGAGLEFLVNKAL